ncbi:MAG: hypothetical protein WCJ60_02350 [bacterium]
MAFKNMNVTPTRKAGTPKMGDSKADANMPANNQGTFPVKLGSAMNSKFGSGVNAGAAQKGAMQGSTAKNKANMSANNHTDNVVKMGTTKHGVGSVPGYLRSK